MQSGSGGHTFRSWVWALVPLLSLGILCWAPAVHAWARLRERALAFWMLLLSTITVLEFVAIGLDPTTNDPSADVTLATVASTALIPTTIVLGSVHSFRLRRRVFASLPPHDRSAAFDQRSTAAIAQVEHARARRAEARALVARDPAMARELGIGRPEITPHDYDDGGLVDLNHVSPDVMVSQLELTRSQADEIATARAQIEGFGSLDEIAAYTTLPPAVVDGLRERAVVIRY